MWTLIAFMLVNGHHVNFEVIDIYSTYDHCVEARQELEWFAEEEGLENVFVGCAIEA